MRGIPKRGRGKSGRSSSEAALLRAFERLLQRHGLTGVRVNAVLEDARVGKRLLYKYFGDLPGLAAAWAKQRNDPLALGKRAAELRRKLIALPDEQRIAVVLVDYANALRRHPWAAQVMIAELSAEAPLGKALTEIRREMGREYERLLLETSSFPNQQVVDLGFILHAAASYLALRGRAAPDYNGVNLATKQGWNAAMHALQHVAMPRAPERQPRPRRKAVSARARRQPRALRA
jgi:AcrR family transcriptional regulator